MARRPEGTSGRGRESASPTSSAESKACFAPIPGRAATDRRLKGEHFRVLIIVALHDRMGRNGMGCTASQVRLAEKVGMDRSSFNKRLKELVEWGYVRVEQSPWGKGRQLRVVYEDDADLAALKGTDVGAQTNKDVGTGANTRSEGVGTAEKQLIEIAGESENKISHEAVRYSAEAVRITHVSGSAGADPSVQAHFAREDDPCLVELGQKLRKHWNDPDTLADIADEASQAMHDHEAAGRHDLAVKASRVGAVAGERWHDFEYGGDAAAPPTDDERADLRALLRDLAERKGMHRAMGAVAFQYLPAKRLRSLLRIKRTAWLTDADLEGALHEGIRLAERAGA